MISTAKAAGQTHPRRLESVKPILFSYGFRPFFLGAGFWAVATMVLWIISLTSGLPVGGSYEALNWHAHEMLYGFAPAILAGFLLTAIPNWTGRLPVSGARLAALFSVWAVGRLALLYPDILGLKISVSLEILFLPSLLFICAREIIVGKQWRNLPVLGAITAVMLGNICFNYSVLVTGDISTASRLGISAYMMLIFIIGGRIIPSFTRNWLNRQKLTNFPVPYNRYDAICLLVGAAALLSWVALPDETLTIILAIIAAIMHGIRLYRWKGWSTFAEKLLLSLHFAYLFVPIGFLSIAATAAGVLNIYSALHILTVGLIGGMMLVVIGRVTRGHTGRNLTASATTNASYICILGAALIRPFAEIEPAFFHTILAFSAILWIGAFGLFLIEYAPMLLQERQPRVQQ